MALYCMGDIQGCNDALERLLAEIGFSPSATRCICSAIWSTVGPIRSACCAAASAWMAPCCRCWAATTCTCWPQPTAPAHPRGATRSGDAARPRCPRLAGLAAPAALARWHEHAGQPLLLVHAGVLPDWSAPHALALAEEVQAVLRSDALGPFLHAMYGNQPARWDAQLQGAQRWRAIVNALTRLRFCAPDGTMDFDSTSAYPGAARATALV